MYRLLALDLDGTLLTSRRELSHRTIITVQEALRVGARVVIASARPVRSLTRFYTSLGLRDPLVALNGALTYDVVGSAVHHASSIDLPLADEVVARLRERKLNVTIETDHGWYVDHLEQAIETSIETGDLIPPLGFGNVRTVIDQQLPVYKIITSTAGGRDETLKALLETWILQTFAPRVSVSISGTGFVEMIAAGVSKETAVARLAAEWGIGAEEAIAIGDDLNDIGMIRWAGLGVAMGNALPRVKEVANLLAESNDDDGVASTIERFVL